MKQPPYSYSEAEQICKDFIFLKGVAFDKFKVDGLIIENVVIAPYEDDDKSKFILWHMLFNNLDIPYNYEDDGTGFDVLVFAQSLIEETDKKQVNIFEWLTKNPQFDRQPKLAKTTVKTSGWEIFNRHSKQ